MSAASQPVKGDATGRFAYRPLSNTLPEIRLLNLLPGRRSDPIHCEMRNTSLLSWLRYHALSYVWGDPVAGEAAIKVNGTVLKVRKNLWHALQDLRDPTTPRLLWVDAVCINQDDVCERSKQVEIMGYIYRKAKNVEIYLGPESPVTKDGVDLVRHLGNFIELRIDRYSARNTAWHIEMRNELDRTGAETHPGLIGLFQSPWFQRIWVAQEYALARSTRVHWGTHSFLFNDLINITTVFKVVGSAGPNQMTTGVSHVSTMVHCVPGPTRCQMSLLALLRNFRSFHATDPRDKVYAILSLMSKHEGFDITPDYRLTVEEVYRELVKKYVAATRNLDILVCCLPAASNHALPSWVPDWTSETPLIESHAIGRRYVLTGSERSMNHLWYAHYPYRSALGTEAQIRFHDETDEISVHGFFVSTISSVAPVFENELWLEEIACTFGQLDSRGRSASASPLFNSWLNLLLDDDHVWRRCRSRRAILETLYRVITGNRSGMSHHWTPAVYARHYMELPFADGETVTSRLRRACTKPFIAALKLSARLGDTIPLPGDDELLVSETGHGNGMTNRLYKHRLIVLRNGFVGSSSGPCKPGDHVCVVFGCAMPMILRREPCRDWYRIVGPAYVYGVCEGELMKTDPKSQEFRIR